MSLALIGQRVWCFVPLIKRTLRQFYVLGFDWSESMMLTLTILYPWS